jgi:hypothetical protein
MPGPRADAVSRPRTVVGFDVQRPRLVVGQNGDHGLKKLTGPGPDGFGANRKSLRHQLPRESQVRQPLPRDDAEVGFEQRRAHQSDRGAGERLGEFRAQFRFGIFGPEKQVHGTDKG